MLIVGHICLSGAKRPVSELYDSPFILRPYPFDASKFSHYDCRRKQPNEINVPKASAKGIPNYSIERRIHLVRGQKVMLDADLATLYGVTTGNLNLAVRRNLTRFPKDFMFAMTREEADSLLLQTARAKTGRGGRRTPPFAFTELGVAMLSSVLKSERAVQMNIAIMRAFVRLREMIAHNKDLAVRVDKLEAGHRQVSSILEVLINEIEHMKALPPPSKRKIGFDL